MVDGINPDTHRRCRQSHGGVAQQRILQFVLRAISGVNGLSIHVSGNDTRLYQFVLCTSYSFTDGE